MMKRFCSSWCVWAWLLLSVACGLWTFSSYVNGLPTQLTLRVTGDRPCTVAVFNRMNNVLCSDRYSDCGKAQNLYYLIPRDITIEDLKFAISDAMTLRVERMMAIRKGFWEMRWTVDEIKSDQPWQLQAFGRQPEAFVLDWKMAGVFLGWILFYLVLAVVLSSIACVLKSVLVQDESESFGEKAPRWFWFGLFIVCVMRFGLASARGIVDVPHDALNYVTTAHDLFFGKWFGEPYNCFTLGKSHMYEMLMAFSFWFHLPYLTLLDACHLFVCLGCVFAVRRHCTWRMMLLLFGLLAFCPYLVFVQSSAVQIPLAIAVEAFGVAAAGLFLRAEEPVKRQLGWMVAYGASFCILEFIRDEHQFFELALLAFVACYSLRAYAVHAERRFLKCLLVVGTPLAVCLLYWFPVSALNYSHYGFWGTCERRDADYLKALGTAYGAERVLNDHADCRIPLSCATIAKLAALSPAWSELKPLLLSQTWIEVGNDEQREEDVREKPDLLKNHKGGWTQWAFRSAVANAGHYPNWFAARDFYRRLHGELEAVSGTDGRRLFKVRAASNPPVDMPVIRMFFKKAILILRRYLWDPIPEVPGGHSQHLLLDLRENWLKAFALPMQSRCCYSQLMERDAWPSDALVVTGWGRTRGNRPLSRENFNLQFLDYTMMHRSDVNGGLGLPDRDENGPIDFGFSFMAFKGGDVRVTDPDGTVLFEGPFDGTFCHSEYVHFDIVQDGGCSPEAMRRRLLDRFLDVCDRLSPALTILFLVAFVALAAVFLRRRSDDSFLRLAVPLFVFLFGFGYYLLIALAHVFLQCQYHGIYLYLTPSTVMAWMAGWMAVVLLAGRRR